MSDIQETLSLVRGALADGALAKTFQESAVATSGLTAYDLEAPARTLVPVLTPLRNRIPRVAGRGGIQANWRAVTGINLAGLSPGVGQGNRGGVVASSTADYFAAYRGLGLEDVVTFEAQYAGEGFQDVRALGTENLLSALMIAEEKVILGGLGTFGLGTTPTPTLAAGTGGSLASGTLSVIAVALAFDGYAGASVSGGIPGQISRANAGGSTDSYGGGAAQKSASATVSVAAGGSVSASVAPVRGAVGYAWFWGAAGAETLGAVTTLNSVVIEANAGGTQTAASLPSGDASNNSLVFDGLLAQITKPGSNAYVAFQPTGTAGVGTPLTADGSGGIVEIDTALKAFWDNWRVSPTDIYVSSQEQASITRKILSGGTGAQRFVIQTQQGNVIGGDLVRSYLNRFAMDGAVEIPIRLHPNMPPGTLMFYCDRLSYPLSNVPNVVQMRTRQDYYQIDWPLVDRAFRFGVYADEVLQVYFPPAFGVITNIAPG